MMSQGSLILLGSELYKVVSTSLRAVIWVFGTEWLGQLLRSHQPSILAISGPLMEQEYNLNELCVLFIYLHVPRPFGNPLVSMTSVVWQLVG